MDSTVLPAINEPTATSRLPGLSTETSNASSEDEVVQSPRLNARPKLGSRKSSGTIIIPSNHPAISHEEIQEGDVRSMSPRRSIAQVNALSEGARKDMIAQAKTLQSSLQAIVDKVEVVKSEHEKLEGGNKFLQSCVLSL